MFETMVQLCLKTDPNCLQSIILALHTCVIGGFIHVWYHIKFVIIKQSRLDFAKTTQNVIFAKSQQLFGQFTVIPNTNHIVNNTNQFVPITFYQWSIVKLFVVCLWHFCKYLGVKLSVNHFLKHTNVHITLIVLRT